MAEAGRSADVNVQSEEQPKRTFDHPIYQEISYSNGLINKMKKDEVKRILIDRGLDARGVKKVLQKRLKNHIKKEKLGHARLEQEKRMKSVDFYCVIDFEGTCEKNNPQDYVHEIIEFPAVLVDAKTLNVVSEFHEYCRPLFKQKLSQFCIQLTGVTQETVDSADPFPDVLSKFELWLAKHELGSKHKFGIVTDGPYDMGRFFAQQCRLCSISVPRFARRWINLRKLYRNFYKVQKGTLEDMVNNLGMCFEGRPHSGIDDTRNIARILQKMVQDGCELNFNECLNHHM